MKGYADSLVKACILLVFVSGVYLLSMKTFARQDLTKRQSYVLTTKHYEIDNGVIKPANKVATTIVNIEEGAFKITIQDVATGKLKITVGDRLSFYDVTDKGLEYIGLTNGINTFNVNSLREDFFRSSRLFVKESEIAGLKVFIFRNEHEDYWMEDYYSPLTGYFVLKRVRFDKKSQIQKVEEVINVQFRDLDKSEYEFPKLPVNFEQAEARIAALRNMNTANALNRADRMSEEIARVKQKLEEK